MNKTHVGWSAVLLCYLKADIASRTEICLERVPSTHEKETPAENDIFLFTAKGRNSNLSSFVIIDGIIY